MSLSRLPEQQLQNGTLFRGDYTQRNFAQKMIVAPICQVTRGLLVEKVCQAGRLGARLPPLAWQVSWLNGLRLSVSSNSGWQPSSIELQPH